MSFSPINTALCSFGMSGKLFHAPFLDVNTKFNLYGVLERNSDFAKVKFPSVKVFRNLESLLADENIELVIVNTPNITHFSLTKEIILAGKNVVVEKPFTVTVEEAEELILLAQQKNVTLSVYHNRRFDSDFKTVKEVIEKGLLGEIVDAEMHYDRFVPELSYKLHKETATEGVGSLYDLGSHLIDQALQLFGTPKSIYAELKSYRPNSQVIDFFDVKLYYGHHRVTLKSSYFVRETLPAYIFHGTKGSLIKSKADVQETDLQLGKTPDSPNWGIEPDNEKGILHTEIDGQMNRTFIPSLRGDYMVFYDGIYDAIRNNKPVPVSAVDALLVIKVIEKAMKSNLEKKVVDF